MCPAILSYDYQYGIDNVILLEQIHKFSSHTQFPVIYARVLQIS